MLLEDADDLFFAEPVALHLWSFSMGQSLFQTGLAPRGNVILQIVNMSLDEIKIPKGTTGYKNDTKLFSSNEDTIKFTDGDVRDLSGIIRSGTGGYSSDIIDKSGTIAFKRQTSHTEILPYFFHLSVPRANRTPILCTQQISGNSLYLFFAGIVLPRLKKAIGEDHIAHMHPIFISDLYLNRYYENGQVKKITAIGHRRPNDAADDARQA